MKIGKARGSDLIWESIDHQGEKWFTSKISLYDFSALKTTDQAVSDNLQKLLKNAVRLNPEFLDKWNGFKVITKLEFPRQWGLGSSSTLVHLVAQWADVHPLELFFKAFDGSGYDVACAGSDTPIVYYNDEDEVGYTPVSFHPTFAKDLYFIYQGQKQDTAAGITFYLKNAKKRKTLVKEISRITEEILGCKTLSDFSGLIEEHESLVSASLGLTPVKQDRFSDYWGSIKSLGAWGGDFILATSDRGIEATKEYFEGKGCPVIIPFSKMLYQKKESAVKFIGSERKYNLYT